MVSFFPWQAWNPWIQGANALELFEAWMWFIKWDMDFANEYIDLIT